MAADSVRVICGPTAAGKSAISLGLAVEYGGTIISADSRQIYRGFDIGTAKPGASERRTVPHEGIDILDPAERYSASLWAEQAGRWIAGARRIGRVPLIVGGTGFYIRALFDPLFDSPPVDAGARSQLEVFLSRLDTQELRRWCRELDPAKAAAGRVQLLRAIETALLAGKRLSTLHSRQISSPQFTPRYLVIDPGQSLPSRITNRVDAMIKTGWAAEARSLAAVVGSTAPAWKASGYQTMRLVAERRMDLSTARERIIIETRQYAKRQRTWFRHQLARRGGTASVTRVNPEAPDCAAAIERWWKESS